MRREFVSPGERGNFKKKWTDEDSHDEGIFLEGAEVEPCLAERDAVESVKGKVKRDIGTVGRGYGTRS